MALPLPGPVFADQPHPLPAVTLTLPLPPPEVNEALVAEIE